MLASVLVKLAGKNVFGFLGEVVAFESGDLVRNYPKKHVHQFKTFIPLIKVMSYVFYDRQKLTDKVELHLSLYSRTTMFKLKKKFPEITYVQFV